LQAYGHEDPNMHTTNEAQLYGQVEPNIHPQVLAPSSQVNAILQFSSNSYIVLLFEVTKEFVFGYTWHFHNTTSKTNSYIVFVEILMLQYLVLLKSNKYVFICQT